MRRIPDRIGLVGSLVLFGLPALALWATTGLLIPPLVRSGWAPQTAWFLAGALVFVPLLVAALAGAALALPAPSVPRVLAHLRLRRMTPANWRLAGGAWLFIGLATTALYVVNASVWPRLPPHPPFLPASALEPAQYHILLLWLPFFAVNIIGEELWWRGFIQPRQEPVFGRATWIVQGILHAGFHVSFGPGLMFILLPTVLVLPWAVQRAKNTTVGIVLHAGINGPAFVAVSLGVLPA
ncbi:MAG: CPBP family intramembrane metalloprotease [Reyranella sp.]|nr:CPBP family intramembrane metalloprotease [Reyranella sp.]